MNDDRLSAPATADASCIVVTGAASGIGRAIAHRLGSAGWHVIGIDSSGVGLQETVRLAPQSIEPLELDVTDEMMGPDVLRALGSRHLHGWVNSAAIALAGSLHEASRSDASRLINVNMMGTYWGCAAAVDRFIDQRSGGSIVNVSSIHSTHSFPGWAAYDTAKGGVDALTRYVAVEYGPVGIRSNAVAPGAIATPMNQALIDLSSDPEAEDAAMRRLHPLLRRGEPDEVAAVVEFLMSDAASFVSGAVIPVDGGAAARCYAYDPSEELLSHYRKERP